MHLPQTQGLPCGTCSGELRRDLGAQQLSYHPWCPPSGHVHMPDSGCPSNLDPQGQVKPALVCRADISLASPRSFPRYAPCPMTRMHL